MCYSVDLSVVNASSEYRECTAWTTKSRPRLRLRRKRRGPTDRQRHASKCADRSIRRAKTRPAGEKRFRPNPVLTHDRVIPTSFGQAARAATHMGLEKDH